jgi:hypothetical protein
MNHATMQLKRLLLEHCCCWRRPALYAALFALFAAANLHGAVLPTADGFYGIWYAVGATGDQYAYKYSGGLGTYTHQTSPLAIYSATANKTYFVYGGTDGTSNTLKNYISYYDHATNLLARPREVRHVGGSDNHKNITLTIDDDGYLWVFGNSHGNGGTGNLYKSDQPNSIANFNEIPLPSVFNNNAGSPKLAYSNAFYQSGNGLIAIYNSYDDGRAVHVATSPNGTTWADQKLFDTEDGHYTLARQNGNTIGVSADYHRNGSLDNRTNLYYVQTTDFGQTWTNAAGTSLTTPLTVRNNPALVHDYFAENKLVYMKDIDYDATGNPILLYLTVSDASGDGHLPGPQVGARTIHTAHWTGGAWQIRDVMTTDHNYDHGELSIEADGTWRLTGAFIDGPQQFGTGGELGVWTSQNQGTSWQLAYQLTQNSQYNQTYVRLPVNAHDDFAAYWADGNAFSQSASRLYFSTKNGEVYRMPTQFTSDFVAPELVANLPPPPPPAALRAYEGFNYANSGSPLLNGKDGGTGWGGPWVFSGAAATSNSGFNVSHDDVSLTSGAPSLPATGDRLLLAGTGSGTFQAYRPLAATFNLATEGGRLYASFLFRKATSGGTSSDNMEFDLLAGSSAPLRFGSTSGERFFIYDGGSVPETVTFENVVLGQTYFVVLKIESHAGSPDVYSALVYNSSEAVSLGEPIVWDGMHSFDSSAVIDAVRLWIGAVASGQFDEIRIGTSWLSVTRPLPGDFDGDGMVNGSDFAAWQSNFPKATGATLAMGDADSDGDVDGADFVIWQINFSSTNATTIIPEPMSMTSAALGFTGLVFLVSKMNGVVVDPHEKSQ